MKRSITANERLQAFALYTMAVQHYVKVREFERGIAQILGDKDEYNDFVGDGIYAHDPGCAENFDGVLKKAEIVVKTPKRKKSRS